jgi:hypothetical protein
MWLALLSGSIIWRRKGVGIWIRGKSVGWRGGRELEIREGLQKCGRRREVGL